jgi:hypothetical protein
MNKLEVVDAPLFTGSDWDYEKLRHAYSAIEQIALGEMGLDISPRSRCWTPIHRSACR